MTRAKKLLLLTVAFVLVSQVPFAYRRYKLGRLSAAIQAISSESRESATQGGYVGYRRVIHDHDAHVDVLLGEDASDARAEHVAVVVTRDNDVDLAHLLLTQESATSRVRRSAAPTPRGQVCRTHGFERGLLNDVAGERWPRILRGVRPCV